MMNSPSQSSGPKLPKGQFKCYHCRKVFAQRGGEWHHWESMQVHLCHPCDSQTKSRPERKVG